MDPSKYSNIFTPVPGDYALLSLQKVLGCVVSSLYQSASCSGSINLIQTAAGFFNFAVAIGGGILLIYAVFTQIFGGASEGETPGGSAAAMFTGARVGVGIIFILPVAGGFSVGQILVIQLMIWSSALGDGLWNAVSPSISQNGYATSANLSTTDARLRGMIADAIRVRAAGYVCQRQLNIIAEPFQVGASADATKPVSVLGPVKKIGFVLNAFQDSTRFYNGSVKLCGFVTYTLFNSEAPYDDTASGPNGATTDSVSYRSMRAIVDAAMVVGTTNAWNIIDKAAHDIANKVGDRDDNSINNIIADGVSGGEKAISKALKTLMDDRTGNSQLNAAITSYLNETRKSGWALAVVWQRAGVNMSQFFANSLNSVSFKTEPPRPIEELLQPLVQSGLFTNARLSGSTRQAIVASYGREMGYLSTFDPVFDGYAQAAISIAPSQPGTSDDASYGVTSFFKWLIDKAIMVDSSSANKDKWSDPLANLVNVGVGLADFGMGALGAGAIGSVIGKGSVVGKAASFFGVNVVEQLASAAWFVGSVLFGAGFWLAGVLPLAPLVYFFGAVISWLVVGLEALIAVPIWALTHFVPTREPSLIGNARQGYLLLMGLLVRPMTIVVGLLLSLLIMSVGFDLLNLLFRGVFTVLMPLDGGAVTALLTCTAAILVYLVAATVLVTNSCAMISELGDVALRWIDVNPNSMWNARFGQEAMQPMNPGGNIAGSGLRLGGGVSGVLRRPHGGLRSGGKDKKNDGPN